jgi:hypothetical protein
MVADTEARCDLCFSTSQLIVGDGDPLVCYTCVLERGAVAGNPSVDIGLRDWLAALHVDVVTLGETPTGKPAWTWVGWK